MENAITLIFEGDAVAIFPLEFPVLIIRPPTTIAVSSNTRESAETSPMFQPNVVVIRARLRAPDAKVGVCILLIERSVFSPQNTPY